MSIAEFSIKHRTIVGMLLIVLAVFGVYTISRQNIEFLPGINLPTVIVYTIYPGANASDVEQNVTKIMEDEFVTLPNYKSMDSISQDGVSWITVTYQDNVDPYDQLEEIRYRISSLKNDLPDDLQSDPIALVGGSSMLPSIIFSVSGGQDTARVTDYIENTLRPKLNQIPNISSITITGGKNLRVEVKLRTDDLMSKGISVLQVYQILNNSNTSLPLGAVDYQNKHIQMRYSGALNSIDDIKNITVGSDDKGNLIKLKDVADVSLGYETPTYHTESNGKKLLVVAVTNRTDGNIVKINTAVKKLLKKETKRTNGAVQFSIITDYSRITLSSLKTVIQSGILGILMAIAIIALFLSDAKATTIIGLSIPLSILFSFILMSVRGVTVNLMSLSGLVCALGMVVDGSIVMIEQVYRYYHKGGMTVDECILRGSKEVTGAIFASALTTIVVFIPITMLRGLIGMILKDLAKTIVYALTGSCIVAIVYIPFFMKTLMKKNPPPRKQHAFDRGMNRVEKLYRKALSWCMNNSRFIILTALLLLFISIFLITKLGIAFIPSTDNNDFYVMLDFPQGYSLDQTTAKTRKAEKIIRRIVPEISSLVSYPGKSSDLSSLGRDNSNNAYMLIDLVPVSERKRDIHPIMQDVQKKLSEEIPDCTVRMENGGFDKLLGYASGGGGYGITLISEDMDKLYAEASRVRDELAKDSSVMTAKMDTSFDTNNLVMDMTQDYMASLGVSSYEAGLTSFILFRGTDCGLMSAADDKRYTIHIDSDLSDKPVTLNTLNNIQVKSQGGTMVDFSNLGNFTVQRSVSAINHSDRAKTITVSATLVGEDTSPVTRHIKNYLAEHPLAEGVESTEGGIGELISTSLPTMIRALLIAWFMVYTVMVLQFERFRQPFIVMLTIPFCIIGVVLGLMMFGSTLSLVSVLGIISLGGVVVNNGIILIDYINQLRQQNPAGKEDSSSHLRSMITAGAASRIRPILMTTLTTMLGVVPMAIARGEGSEIYAPLGQAIAGGLFSSTLITLFLIPTLYYITENNQLKKAERKAEHERKK